MYVKLLDLFLLPCKMVGCLILISNHYFQFLTYYITLFKNVNEMKIWQPNGLHVDKQMTMTWKHTLAHWIIGGFKRTLVGYIFILFYIYCYLFHFRRGIEKKTKNRLSRLEYQHKWSVFLILCYFNVVYNYFNLLL